jgi:hypothetical protein
MSVTFIENHDTEPVRDGGNKRFPDDKVMQGYVYILTHPGIPCVFWRHFFDQGEGHGQGGYNNDGLSPTQSSFFVLCTKRF